MTRPLGFLVVGWGRAGRARARAIASDPGCRLVGVVSSREVEGQLALDEALAREDVDAVYVTTVNARHAPVAHAALDAHKHVAVEYPLALSLDEARALHARALERGRVLHPAHIELLAESHTLFRSRVRAAPRAERARLHFTGDSSGWVTRQEEAGFPSFAALGRLTRLLDLFGALTVEAVSLVRPAPQCYTMLSTLRTAWGAPIEWTERRAPGLARGTFCEVDTAAGPLSGYREGARAGVFERSHALFRAALADPAADADLRALDLLALAVAAEIEGRARASGPPNADEAP